MDEVVKKAMAKWPDVPFAYGWLALDARGRWLLKGDPITNPAVVAFIGRNYAADARGRWYFQNGPQRVFVTLSVTPWILSLDVDGHLVTHVGTRAGAARETWLDDAGHVMFVTDVGAHGEHPGAGAPQCIGGSRQPIGVTLPVGQLCTACTASCRKVCRAMPSSKLIGAIQILREPASNSP